MNSSEKIWQIWCGTCEGSGEIDETLGGVSPYADRHAKCPDCDGNGFWLKCFTGINFAEVPLTPKQPALQDKQISIERIGDKTSVTISGHLTKDDVQSILNLIF